MLKNRDEARTAVQNALIALKLGDKESAQRLALDASKLAPELEQPLVDPGRIIQPC